MQLLSDLADLLLEQALRLESVAQLRVALALDFLNLYLLLQLILLNEHLQLVHLRT